MEHVVLLPANVLLPSGSAWLRTAVPLILQQDLASDRSAYAVVAADSSGAYAAQATEEWQTIVDNDAAGQARFTVNVRDLATQRTSGTFQVDPPGDVISAVDALAKRLDPDAARFSTRNASALRAYVEAAETAAPRDRVAKLQNVVSGDPNFGLAYLALIEVEAQSGSPDLSTTLSTAKAHEAGFVPYDRARLDLLLARFARAPLATVAQAAEAVLQVAPHDIEALAALGQVRFLQGNAAAGEGALIQALELNASDARLREQLAMGFLETRQFVRAEKAWREMNGSSGTLLNLATAVLLSGDRSRASSVLENSLQAKGGESNSFPLIVRAQWAVIGSPDMTDGPRRGLTLLRTQAQATGDVAALAEMQSAVWLQQTGDHAAAESSAAQALRLAVNPSIKQTAQAVLLMVSAGSANALQMRVDALQADDATKNLVLGYGLFLYGDYAAAAGQWRALLTSTGETDLRSRAMLASCLNRAGQKTAAFAMVVEPFVPNLSGMDPFATIAFNEMRQLLRL